MKILEGIHTFIDNATTADLGAAQKLIETEVINRRQTFHVDGACTGSVSDPPGTRIMRAVVCDVGGKAVF
jgi:hypothetical protein